MLIQMGIVISMCPPKLQEHLQDMEDRMQNYQQLRAEITRKVDLAEVTRRSSTSRSDSNMDIGGLANPDFLSEEQRARSQNDQDTCSPWWNGEIDLAALQPWKGKGKGKKGDQKGKGKGQWSRQYTYPKRDGEKGGKPSMSKGHKGDGKGPSSGGKDEGEFQGYCDHCWVWGHQARICPQWKVQDANPLETQDPQESSQTG